MNELPPSSSRLPSRAGRLAAATVLAAVALIAVLAVVENRRDASLRVATESADAASAPAPAAAVNETAPDETVKEAEVMAENAEDTAPATTVTGRLIIDGPKLQQPPPVLGVEEELENIDGWLQSDIESLADLDGKVHIVQFWTFGCYNCKNTLPTLKHINETYAGDDFEIVGVHSPEFDREKDPANIQEAADNLGVTWPIALDTEKTNFRSWQSNRRFWPRTYVIDQEGNIRFDRIGEGAYEQLEATVAWLLEEGSGL